MSELSGMSNIFEENSEAWLWDASPTGGFKSHCESDFQRHPGQRFRKPMHISNVSRLQEWEQQAIALTEIYEQLDTQLNKINDNMQKLDRSRSKLTITDRLSEVGARNEVKCPYKLLHEHNDPESTPPEVFVMFQKKPQ